ncbi:MAG: protein kinase [candidate division Zixibacteria bacterium]|nr:protein kinase [candidate division Zixibacteria bacterium]
MSVSEYKLQPGKPLGSNYTIRGFLGSGWEGEVYKVRENKTGVVRAAKLFYKRRGSSKLSIMRYARKLHKLKSCNVIIQYHHRGEAPINGDTVEFLVSDYVDGEMLSSFVNRQRGRRLSSFEALHLFYALVKGVEQIHFRGEYHGDIHSDNIMVKRKGLEFDVSLVDFYDLGRPTREKIHNDVIDLVNILYEIIGGGKWYRKCGDDIKQIIRGRKHNLILEKFKNAGHLRLALDNLDWGE